MCGGRHWKNYWSLLNALDVRVARKPCVSLQCVFITLTVEAIMYCAYPVPGMGGNSLMYYYNGKSVSTLFGNVHARCRSAGGKCVQSVRLSLLVHLSVPYDVFFFCTCIVVFGSTCCVCLNLLVLKVTFLQFSTAEFKSA